MLCIHLKAAGNAQAADGGGGKAITVASGKSRLRASVARIAAQLLDRSAAPVLKVT
jgi:hypothetical protein